MKNELDKKGGIYVRNKIPFASLKFFPFRLFSSQFILCCDYALNNGCTDNER